MSTVYEVLTKQLNDLKSFRVDTVTGGTVPNYAEYRALCGEIHGLNLALREVQDLANRQQETEND